MSNFFKSIKSVVLLSLLSAVLVGCQSISTTGISTYSPQSKQSERIGSKERKAKWDARIASIREKQQARILEVRERRLAAAEKRKEASAKRKDLTEKRRNEAQKKLALRMSSNKTAKKAKLKNNQAKINRAFGRAKDKDDGSKSLRTGWVKIDGKFVYRSAKTIKAEQEAARKKVRRKANPKGSYGKLIAKYAAQHGVPYRLARAVVQVESSFRAGVTGGAGEIGLMQIKLATARGMGYKGSRKQLYNPATNLYWGMKYLGKAHRLAGGSTCGTILKYNAGHGAKSMNPISRRYCNRVSRII